MTEEMYVYSASDLGLDHWTDILLTSESTVVQGAPDILTLADDDPLFDDEGAGSTQLLTQDLYIDGVLTATAGVVAENIGFSTVVNQDTGGSGLLYYIQIDGEVVGFATTIALNPEDHLDISQMDFSSPFTAPYDDLTACFTRGTMILCQHGARLIETLECGDLVQTRDNGLQKIRWVSRQKVKATGTLAPIRFKAGVLGNAADLLVSPMHRMLVSGWRAELLFGLSDVLVHARDLCDGDRIFSAPMPEVEYIHLLFDHHEVVNTYGTWSESFAPTVEAMDALEQATRDEMLAIFPHLGVNWQDAHPTLMPHEAALLSTAG